MKKSRRQVITNKLGYKFVVETPAPKPEAKGDPSPLNIEMADRHLRIAAKRLREGRITKGEFAAIERQLIDRVKKGLL